MMHTIRNQAQSEEGFTLIELLVVILIIGILAAIALPAFLNQREKAQDSEAKSAARTAQTAMETWYTDNQNYSATKADLEAIEPALKNANTFTVTPGTDAYTVSVLSKSGATRTFSITKDNAGIVKRRCGVAGAGGCKTADASGNMW